MLHNATNLSRRAESQRATSRGIDRRRLLKA